LNQFIEIASKNDVIVFLVSTPKRETYLKHLNPNILKKIDDCCRSLESTKNNVYYFNYRNNIQFGYNDFYDADHLNMIGAKKLSAILNQKIASTTLITESN
jgi:hypothetical protein